LPRYSYVTADSWAATYLVVVAAIVDRRPLPYIPHIRSAPGGEIQTKASHHDESRFRRHIFRRFIGTRPGDRAEALKRRTDAMPTKFWLARQLQFFVSFDLTRLGDPAKAFWPAAPVLFDLYF
jgi:hypothetical protein